MPSSSVGTYLRFLRRRSGLSQRALARILGSVTASQISRHERSVNPPPLITAFGYQVVFRVPVAEIFPGLFHTIESGIEDQLAAWEAALGERSAKGRSAVRIASQLEWLTERKDS